MSALWNHWLSWALLSALFAGATAVLAKVGVEGVNSNLATAIRTTVILLFTWALVAMTVPGGAVSLISRKGWIFLILSGVATGLSWVCYFRALQLGPASQVAPIDKLSVVFVIAFAALFLGEAVDWRHWVGGGLIVAGAVILTLPK